MDTVRHFIAKEFAEDLDACAHHLESEGFLVLTEALPSATCRNLAAFVDSSLAAVQSEMADASDETRDSLEESHFGNVRCRRCRYDLKLPLNGAVQEALAFLVTKVGQLLVHCSATANRRFGVSVWFVVFVIVCVLRLM